MHAAGGASHVPRGPLSRPSPSRSFDPRRGLDFEGDGTWKGGRRVDGGTEEVGLGRKGRTRTCEFIRLAGHVIRVRPAVRQLSDFVTTATFASYRDITKLNATAGGLLLPPGLSVHMKNKKRTFFLFLFDVF